MCRIQEKALKWQNIEYIERKNVQCWLKNGIPKKNYIGADDLALDLELITSFVNKHQYTWLVVMPNQHSGDQQIGLRKPISVSSLT